MTLKPWRRKYRQKKKKKTPPKNTKNREQKTKGIQSAAEQECETHRA